MREILHTHFGRGIKQPAIVNDVRMTLNKVRLDYPKPEILYVSVSPERYYELLRDTDLNYLSAHRLDQLFGHTLYLDLGLEGDEAGYRMVHLR
jgi:hypothetical protein